MKKAISLCKATYLELEDNIVASGFQSASSAKMAHFSLSRGVTKASQCTYPFLADDLFPTLIHLIADRSVDELLLTFSLDCLLARGAT